MPQAPAPVLPADATNAHCHVFGPRDRFPYAADAPFVPAADAPKEALFALNDRLGFSRCVVVQSTCHGHDNGAVEDTIAARPATYRGIALLPTDVSDAELQRLDRAGFRGVRFNYSSHLGRGTPVEQVLALAERLVPLRWHLQVHGDAGAIAEVGAALAEAPVPVVIDHIGRIDAGLGIDHSHFRSLMRLMGHDHVWVKLSGIDRITRLGPPYADALPFAARLATDFPDRVLWGNDWPHPNHAGPVPDEDALAAAIVQIAPSAAARQRLLVDNPQILYRFET